MATRIAANQLKRNLYKNNTTTCKNIRFLRILTGRRQQEVADRVHLSRSAYFAIEKGRKLPDYETLSILSEYYDVNMDYFISFDIADQLLHMLKINQEEINAVNFIEKFSSLSRAGKKNIKTEIMKIRDYEKRFNKFPWDYEDIGEIERMLEEALARERAEALAKEMREALAREKEEALAKEMEETEKDDRQ